MGIEKSTRFFVPTEDTMQLAEADGFKLLDTNEACAALRVSKSTLHRLVKKGRIHRSTATVGRNLFPITEIRRLIGIQTAPSAHTSSVFTERMGA